MKQGYRYWQRKSLIASLILGGTLCFLAGAETAGIAVLIEDGAIGMAIFLGIGGVLVTLGIAAHATLIDVNRLFDSIKD